MMTSNPAFSPRNYNEDTGPILSRQGPLQEIAPIITSMFPPVSPEINVKKER